MRNTSKKVAESLCSYLNRKGIATDSDFSLLPIQKVLRGSWYVDAIKQRGYTDCIFVDVRHEDYCANSFFAVLENGDIMTGGNIFISDAFMAFDWSADAVDYILARPSLYKVKEVDDDVLIVTSLKGVTTFFDRLDFIN